MEERDLADGLDRTRSGAPRRQAVPDHISPSGDGHGRREDAFSIPGGSADLPYLTPRLANDERSSFPTYGDELGPYPGSGDGHGRRAESPMLDYAQTPPWMGDGHGNGRAPLPAVALVQSGGLAHPSGLAYAGGMDFAQPAQLTARVAQPTPKAELWKLLMLVVFFVIWISTASTLLFLYMDRYLFPG